MSEFACGVSTRVKQSEWAISVAPVQSVCAVAMISSSFQFLRYTLLVISKTVNTMQHKSLNGHSATLVLSIYAVVVIPSSFQFAGYARLVISKTAHPSCSSFHQTQVQSLFILVTHVGETSLTETWLVKMLTQKLCANFHVAAADGFETVC